jgi:hypothetical protein
MIGAKIANISQGERTDIEPSANWQKVSQPQAAKMLNVSVVTHQVANLQLDIEPSANLPEDKISQKLLKCYLSNPVFFTSVSPYNYNIPHQISR